MSPSVLSLQKWLTPTSLHHANVAPVRDACIHIVMDVVTPSYIYMYVLGCICMPAMCLYAVQYEV